MKAPVTATLAGLAALLLVAGCNEAPPAAPAAEAPPANEDPTVQVASAPPVAPSTIDWDAARADAAKRPADMVVPQSVGSAPLTVPMLLPGNVGVQTASDTPTQPRIITDGYIANYRMPRYDVIVNGSSKAYAVPGQTPAADKTQMKFQKVEAGAQLAFSRYGADYLIEFECREVDSPEGCISEAEATEFADSLFVAASR